MIVATAGHIDHGKTSLVRALTGVDTDRLPEERRRGMSIDLGFAHRSVPGGRSIAFVDVPGHEKFLRNMLAGAAAMDFALLVVAADDGPMPQTLEHLAIIGLLQVRRGAVVITKCDRVDAQRRETVAREALQRAIEAGMDAPPVFEVSSTTGEGIAALLAHLEAEAALPREAAASGHHFRMTVDKVMTIPGHGTVLAGTVIAGTARTGGIVTLCPASRRLRIRGLQSAGRAVDAVAAGQRCAVNVAWKDAAVDIARGDCLVDAAIDRATNELALDVRLLPGFEVSQRAADVQLCIGTASVAARIRRVDAPGIPASEPACLCLVRTLQPVHAVAGDRFVLRGGPAHRVIGGGRVIDPFPGPRQHPDRWSRLEALAANRAEDAVLALAARARHGAPLDDLAIAFNIAPAQLQSLCDRNGIGVWGTRPARIGVTAQRLDQLREHLVQSVQFRSLAGGEAGGTPFAQLAGPRELRLPAAAIAQVVDQLVAEGRLQRNGNRLLPPGVQPPAANEGLDWIHVLRALEQVSPRPSRLKDVAARLGIDEQQLGAFLAARGRRGDVLRIADRVYASVACGKLLVDAFRNACAASGGGVSVAAYRDRTGLNRREAVQVLEYFDRVGYSRLRAGEHVLQPTSIHEQAGGT